MRGDIPKGRIVREIGGLASHVIHGGDVILRDSTGFRYMPCKEARSLTLTALTRMIKKNQLYYPPEGKVV